MDYGSAISKVIPGSFVPDIGAATRLDESPAVTPIPGVGEAAQTSFKDTVKSMLADVNDKLQASDQATRDLASGKTNDLQKVVTSVEEANLALNFATAMRSKLLEAYTEISRMQL
jgi:flagellar hook-basal body complex protein FliE